MNGSSSPASGGMSSHAVIGVLLFVVGFLVLLVGFTLRSQADQANTEVGVNNQAPTVNDLTVSESDQGSATVSIIPDELATKSVYVYGTYTDNNGCSQVSTDGTLKLTLYKATVGANCTADEADCLNENTVSYACSSNVGATCTGGTDVTATYQCSVPLRYFATPGEWVARIVATDVANATGNKTQAITIETLTALNVTGPINFGALALGAQSSVGSLTVQNTGNNNDMDVEVSGTAMSCTVGSIPVGNIKFATTTETPASYDDLGAPATVNAYEAGMSIPKATELAVSTKNTWWGVQIPSSGLSGTCNGTLTFGAVSN